jgi:glucosamine--fructose-6-phosphate aminotransferase (isomerizing)
LFGADAERVLENVDGVLILACGTSYHAGMAGRYWLESMAGLPCSVEIASEYRYRESAPNPGSLVIVISQSGETADTLAALHHARSLGRRYCSPTTPPSPVATTSTNRETSPDRME